jgi:hypothetical protein
MSAPKEPDGDSARRRLEDNLSAYRQSLLAAEQAMQGEYDKGVLTLSAGALGISLVFLKDVVGTRPLVHSWCLLAAWIVWSLSIAFVLSSYFTITKALRRAVMDTDLKDIYVTLAQSCWATATKVVNAAGGICFFIGIVLLVTFVSFNLTK